MILITEPAAEEVYAEVEWRLSPKESMCSAGNFLAKETINTITVKGKVFP